VFVVYQIIYHRYRCLFR